MSTMEIFAFPPGRSLLYFRFSVAYAREIRAALQTNRRADARTDGRGQTKVWTSLAHSDRTPWTPLARFPDTLDRGVHARTDVFLFCPRSVMETLYGSQP